MPEPIQASTPNRSGTLTTAMRAMPMPRGPRVLRVGVLRAGAIVEERILAPRAPLTVGTSERATVTLSAHGIAARATLIEPTRDGYVLSISRGMTGRIAMEGRTTSLDGSRPTRIALGDDARGMVAIGDTTILFQMTPPAPAHAKAVLPTSVRQGLASDIDWATTMIACFSFLLHFGAVGALYSDWMDPTVDDGVSLGQLVDSVAALPIPPVETSHEPSEVATSSTKTDTAPPTPVAHSGGGGPSQRTSASSGSKPMSDAQSHAISSELRGLNMVVLAALNADGASTRDVLGSSSDLPTSNLEKASASAAGVTEGGIPGLKIDGAGGSTRRPGQSGKGFGDIGNVESNGPITAGTASHVAPPPRAGVTSGAVPQAGNVGNAAKVVAGMSPGFRRCYQNGLNEDETMKGSMRVTARIGPNGEVTSATPSAVSGLSSSVVACVARRVGSAVFDKPEGGGATVVIPIGFYSQ